jgi:hypothetical protein
VPRNHLSDEKAVAANQAAKQTQPRVSNPKILNRQFSEAFAAGQPYPLSPATVLLLQRTGGNAAVSRMLASSPGRRSGRPVVQRILQSHEVRGDAGKIVDQTGGVGLVHDYSRWLAQDRSALVDGEPKGVPGLVKRLKAVDVDGEALQGEIVDSIMASGSWKEVGEADKVSLVEHVRAANSDLPEQEEDQSATDYIYDNLFDESYPDDIKDWVAGKLGLAGKDTVGAVVSSNPPLAFHGDMAYLLYEATKDTFYAADIVAFVPVFKQLIADANTEAVQEFEFVRKYGAASNNWGAEFKVKRPSDLKDKYEDKAVLHTHYPDGNSAPNYAHTKPFEKRFDAGFGGTIVATDKVTNKDDTRTEWRNL